MITIQRFALPALAIFLAAGSSAQRATAAPLTSPLPAVIQDRGFDDAPREFNDIQRRGFRDGIDGAHHDMDNHRTPDVNNRDEYRHPNVQGRLRQQYRDAFRRGYQSAYSRMGGSGPLPPPQPIQPVQPPFGGTFGWGGMPGRFSEFQRRGYQDGILGAQRDMENHRRPNPENRDEYRDPNVPPQFQDEYREGFRRGYSQTISQAYGVQDQGPWDSSPGRFSDLQRQGFRDGMEGARKDVENHRRPDPNNRDEYRNPNVPYQLQDEYREGFRWGYERAMDHMMGR